MDEIVETPKGVTIAVRSGPEPETTGIGMTNVAGTKSATGIAPNDQVGILATNEITTDVDPGLTSAIIIERRRPSRTSARLRETGIMMTDEVRGNVPNGNDVKCPLLQTRSCWI